MTTFIGRFSPQQPTTPTPNPLQSDVLRVTVIGGGPVAQIFSALVASRMDERQVRIRIFDHRWSSSGGDKIRWKNEAEGNRRRQQVVTLQSRQYRLLPDDLVRHLLPPDSASTIWPLGPDSVRDEFPVNIRISLLEDLLLDWTQSLPQIQLVPAGLDIVKQQDELSNEHLVVICDGAASKNRDALKIFGKPDSEAFCTGGRKLDDLVLGLQVKSRLHPSAAVLWTIAQNRFLLNPGGNGEGFLNMRLTDQEALEIRGIDPTQQAAYYPCTQGRPCMPARASHRISRTDLSNPPLLFAPSFPDTESRLWPRVMEGLRLFDVDLVDLKSITSFRLSMVQRPRFTGVLRHQTSSRPATVASLLGDAAISVHFWPGRGLNTGIGSAAALARTVVERWQGRPFREADFAGFEAQMSQLQFRNQTRGFYGSMRVDDATGEVSPIRDLISSAYNEGEIDQEKDAENRQALSSQLSDLRESLRRRLPGRVPSLEELSGRIDLLCPETVAALVKSGPWDTYRPGGPELDLSAWSFADKSESNVFDGYGGWLEIRRDRQAGDRQKATPEFVINDESGGRHASDLLGKLRLSGAPGIKRMSQVGGSSFS